MFALSELTDVKSFTKAQAAVAYAKDLYAEAIDGLCDAFEAFQEDPSVKAPDTARYPFMGLEVTPANVAAPPTRLSYGMVSNPGVFGTTLTHPELFEDYYLEQVSLLLENHGQPLVVGRSPQAIPLTFAVERASMGMTTEWQPALRAAFPLPDLAAIHDQVPNGTYKTPPGKAMPLSLFAADRVDLSLNRLRHYTGTTPQHFQRYVLFTNYQRYVDEFIAYGLEQVQNGDRYCGFVEPGDFVTPNPKRNTMSAGGEKPAKLPQMPAYHLVGENKDGITLVNIGVGPSNAKTITDHIAVLRPHCWLMVGHCGGLRKRQQLGDYVLAHAYVRFDQVLDEDLPPWVPVPPIAEVQVALTQAVQEITGLEKRDLKARLRTGTVMTTDDRNWEFRYSDLAVQMNQSRAIGIDMESGTIAANGYRMRVPYGTLLCVSDRPLHGEIKLPGMANRFYEERIAQHLKISLRALDILREDVGRSALHSRKLRSFDEPAFR